jgi:hypothetical protein
MDRTVLVVLVGHDPKKLDRLKHLYELTKPKEKHDLCIVYNGEGIYPDADIICENSHKGKDVEMYARAVEFKEADFYFFLNDDVCYIKDEYWLAYALSFDVEVIGVQPNLASLIPHDIIKEVSGKITNTQEKQGTIPQFIRTSSFGCTRDYFLRVWNQSSGSAQQFEKATLRMANSVGFFLDPFYIYDGNLDPYVRYFCENFMDYFGKIHKK